MKKINLPKIPILTDTVPNELYDSLLRESYEVFNKENLSFSTELAGHIKKEYYLKENIRVIKNYIHSLSKKLASTMDKIDMGYHGNDFLLKELWVNFQKKHEFNPLHVHGGIFSFVIFIKIPYDLHDEEKLFNAQSLHVSKLEFYYTNILGRIVNFDLNINKSDEKTILFFPSKLNHIVYPFFTNDDYRITISGNVYGK